MVELIGTWIELQRSKGVEISVATVGALYDFGYWLETQAAQPTLAGGRLELVRVFDESEVEEVSLGEYRVKPAACDAGR